MDTSVAGVTVRVVVPDTSPDAAVMAVLPADLPYAYARRIPLFCNALDSTELPVVASTPIVATVVSEELQVTEAVRSFVVLSE
jgi:hypothetical protein